MEKRDTHAIILDFHPEGYPHDKRPSHRKTPVAQAITTNKYALLELVPKDGVFLSIGDEVYIGEGKREQINHIETRLPLKKLTNTAQGELQYVLEQLIERNEQDFVAFFNEAKPLSMRMHSLELLPGLGKKHMWLVLEAREEQPFTSFSDIKERIKVLKEPQKLILKRIQQEIAGTEKHKLFVE